jgi:2-amino-4-hydroxy-6-hydroxymethyldihydropteridine diphosphokinase
MTTAYLALGSNIGDRAANLRAACEHLESISAVEIVAKSRVYETQSMESGGPGDFLNAALRVRTALTAVQLLRWVQEVETLFGRPQPPRTGPRLIDIDILLYGKETIDTPELQVPHPRMFYRAFVLRPLCDVLEGGWITESDEEL